MTKTIFVVAAIIMDGSRILATQRGYGPWRDWCEFPGGKVEEGESPEDALTREIKEELDTEISVDKYIRTVEWDYPEFHLSMRCYQCSVISGSLVLKEHEAARWLERDQLHDVRWLPADEELIESLKEFI